MEVYENSSSDEQETSMVTNNSPDIKNHSRHSNYQVQKLEEYFIECPQPDEEQRRRLGQQLNLTPSQIKFWFQNRRTQAKTQREKEDNAVLRKQNIELKSENDALADVLNSVLCPPCGGRGFGREGQIINLQKLHAENALLKREVERLARIIIQHGGVEALTNILGQSIYGPTSNNPRASFGTSSNIFHHQPYGRENINTSRPFQRLKQFLPPHFTPLSEMEKMIMLETGKKAVIEVMTLILEESLWKNSAIDVRLVIDQEKYEKCFPKIYRFMGLSSFPESSKDVVVVQMEATILVQMFLDTDKWARLFPAIVSEAKTIHQFDSMDNGRQNFSRVIYEELHILSPLVPPREFIILRSCHQLEENMWMIADVSYKLPNFEFDSTAQICTKHPSGVLIQALAHGCSKVTWVEHVEVPDKMRPNRIYRDLFYGGLGYGAPRWTTSLETMCERLCLTSISDFPNDNTGVVQTIEGRKSVMMLGERMLKEFACIMKMDEKAVDFSHMTESKNSGIRIWMQPKKEAGQHVSNNFCACSSLCLPYHPLQVYDFLRNPDIRHQWDLLCHGKPVKEVARLVTGTDPNNHVNFLWPSCGEENGGLMILEDGFINALGGMVVHAPMDLNLASAAISGQEDPSNISILPSGFIISLNGRPSSYELDNGYPTILTVFFQILMSPDKETSECATTVNAFISATIQRIKAMLNCQ